MKFDRSLLDVSTKEKLVQKHVFAKYSYYEFLQRNRSIC